MNSIKIKLPSQTFILDKEDENEVLNFLSKKHKKRSKKIKKAFDTAKEKIMSENPDITPVKLTHQLSYVLSIAGYRHEDIAKYLKIDRTTSYRNRQRVENKMWVENKTWRTSHQSIPKKTMVKRLSEMEKYAQRVVANGVMSNFAEK